MLESGVGYGRRRDKEGSEVSGLNNQKGGAAIKRDGKKCGRNKIERWIRSSTCGHSSGNIRLSFVNMICSGKRSSQEI